MIRNSIFGLLLFVFFHLNVFASTGVILSGDKKIRFFKDDVFVKVIKEVNSTDVAIYNSGEYYYVSGSYPKINKYYIEKCNFIDFKCKEIGTPLGRAKPVGISFLNNGTGFVATSDGQIDYYENEKFIRTVLRTFGTISSINFTGNSLYYLVQNWNNDGTINNSYIAKCDKFGSNCNLLYNDYYLYKLSFSDTGEGFVISKDDDYSFLYFKNDEDLIRLGIFVPFSDVSFTGKDVYLVVGYWDANLIKINDNGGWDTLYSSSNNNILSISFK